MLPIALFWLLSIVEAFHSDSVSLPAFNVTKSGKELSDGSLFLTIGTPFILTPDASDLVWHTYADGSNTTTNLLVQKLENQQVLTYWHGVGGPVLAGHGFGEVRILDNSYKTIFTVCPDLVLVTEVGPTAGCALDTHESYLTDRGTLLATGYNVTQYDLRSIGGSEDGWVFDSLFFEIDVKTNKILFTWSALSSGIPISSTKIALGSSGTTQLAPIDWFHINSVSTTSNGFIVNARNTFGVYGLDSNGIVLWTLDGETGGDFTIEGGLNFSYQHQARVRNETTTTLDITLFDDANGAASTSFRSKGLNLHLDFNSKLVTAIQIYQDLSHNWASSSQGSYDLQPNGNVVIGYGNIPTIQEFGPSGDLRFSAVYAGVGSYRAFKNVWVGAPSEPPSVAISACGTTGWVSWNGDTRTISWVIYAGNTEASLAKIGTIDRAGFETEFAIPWTALVVQVGAFGYSGFLGNSSIIVL
ncbi:hypothetical protein HDU82_008595 [Entophlyctis luteolus]|nr:hypothetical protein HDU82_008595 [Entophlyctis luteolus]KAJ3385712.1 hypothetical protein HDU84_002056 [Entophlyctis sp. JEL0112]